MVGVHRDGEEHRFVHCLFSGWLSGKKKKKKKSTCSAGDAGSISGLGRSPEKEMANHSSTLAWEIPWTVEPGGLWSTGSQRVRHDLMTKQQHVNYLVFKIAKKKKKYHL